MQAEIANEEKYNHICVALQAQKDSVATDTTRQGIESYGIGLKNLTWL